jgi:hypothetical protein
VIRRYRNRKKTTKPWIVALAQLQDLKKQGRAQALHAKQFYFSLTTIIKEYLAARFGVDVKGKTDEELLIFLKTHAVLGSLLIDEIQRIVDGSVFVRFANEAAAQEHIDRDFARARDIITKTIPKEKEQ